MAVPKSSAIPPPSPAELLTPVLPALTAAAASKEPADAVLPLLAPILRQRVKFLAPSSSDPWLRLLCYDMSKAAKLAEIVSSPALEPHPVSGEVEVDWDYDSETRFRRLDSETLQALTVLKELGIAFQLQYCVGDAEGGGDGWRIGEVTTPAPSSPFAIFGDATTIAEAEENFANHKTAKPPVLQTNGGANEEEAEEEDDGYWDRYDTTPARTPAQKQSPAPQSYTSGGPALTGGASQTKNDDEDDADYYAQYDQVQPAMDNHDPDEQAAVEQLAPPPLGLAEQRPLTNASYDLRSSPGGGSDGGAPQHDRISEGLLHPRPESSASSNGSQTVAKLEQEADKRDHAEFGVKQHVSRSIRSLFQLSRASGIEREEFESIVQRELDLLGMMGDMD